MIEPLVIELAGKPVAKGRPRFVSRGEGRPVAFTPGKTRTYESHLRLAAMKVMAGRPLLTGALVMRVTASMPIPQSWSKKKQREAHAGIVRPTTRPDWDNFGKIASDALNCVVFVDDAQIVDSHVSKIYSDQPGLRIEIAHIAASGQAEPSLIGEAA